MSGTGRLTTLQTDMKLEKSILAFRQSDLVRFICVRRQSVVRHRLPARVSLYPRVSCVWGCVMWKLRTLITRKTHRKGHCLCAVSPPLMYLSKVILSTSHNTSGEVFSRTGCQPVRGGMNALVARSTADARLPSGGWGQPPSRFAPPR